MDKSILDMVHDSAKDLHAAGVMKETTLREFDALYDQASHASESCPKGNTYKVQPVC